MILRAQLPLALSLTGLLLLSIRPGSSASAPPPPLGAPEQSPATTEARPELLKLEEIFRHPIGPRGLEYSERAKSLEGKRVRMVGHMVRQTAPAPYTLLLTPLPLQTHEREYGLADDLPASTVQVTFPRGPQPVIPPARGTIELEGILELGPAEGPDGRLTHIRLRVTRPWTGFRRPSSDPTPAAGEPAPVVSGAR